MIAEVLVDVENSAVDQKFDYLVPTIFQSIIQRSQRVIIPFGPRKITGFVVGFKDKTTVKNLKPIDDIIDLTPYFDKTDLALSKILSDTYFHPQISYLNAMLPPGLSMRYQTLYHARDIDTLPPALKALFKTTTTLKAKAIPKSLKPLIKEALEQGNITQEQKIKQASQVKRVPYVYLQDSAFTPRKGAHQQVAIIKQLKHHPKGISKKKLLNSLKASSSTLNTLKDKGVVTIHYQETTREIVSYYQENDKPITLTQVQQTCYEAVANHYNHAQTYLLHGVIASGKTELYIHWLKDVLKAGKRGLLLLPEIALTPKILARIKAAINVPTAVYHSALSIGEQYDQWRKIKAGEVDLVIGARSAIFTPIKQLGIIIIDEAQSDAYIQREHAEYDTNFIAKIKSKQHQCPLILGSATPSIKDYYLAKDKHTYTYLALKERALKRPKPEIHLVDMKQEFKQNNPSIFSKHLQAAIQKRLENNLQTLILINRRGHARFVLCRACSHRMLCPNCELSLTYHQTQDKLKCHYCNYEEAMPKFCPSCGSKHIRFMGLGSQKVETEIKKHFPTANVFRLDRDTTTTKGAHERLLYDFEHQGDILIGTQMIAKGLDFDKVTLVSVLSADMSLFVPDFYAESETFMLLHQMAGRSGRREAAGEVIIQAYDIDHPILSFVQTQDYEAFYAREIEFRKQARVSPFYELIQLMSSHKNYHTAYKNALKIKQQLTTLKDVEIIGPADAKLRRLMGQYHVQLLLRHQDNQAIHKQLKDLQKAMPKQLSITKHPRVF